jgi:hypothetical protein
MSMGVSLALPPDLTFGFLWDMRALDAVINNLMLNAACFIPFRKEQIDLMQSVVDMFGLKIPLPIFKIIYFEVPKFSLAKLVLGGGAIKFKWNFFFLGRYYSGGMSISAVALLEKGLVGLLNWKEHATAVYTAILKFIGGEVPKIFSFIINLSPTMQLMGLEFQVESRDSAWLTVTLMAQSSFLYRVVGSLLKSAWKVALNPLLPFEIMSANEKKALEEQGYSPKGEELVQQSSQLSTEEDASLGMDAAMASIGPRAKQLLQELLSPDAVLFHSPEVYLTKIYPELSARGKDSSAFDAEVEALSLIRLVPTDMKAACEVEHRIKSNVGASKFHELTGVTELQCGHTAAQEDAAAGTGIPGGKSRQRMADSHTDGTELLPLSCGGQPT